MSPLLSPADLLARVRDFDNRVDTAFDAIRGNKTADRLFYAASELGDFSLIWHLVGAARGLTSDRRANEAIRLSAVLAGESVLINGVVKSFFRRRRPEWLSEAPRPHRLRRPEPHAVVPPVPRVVDSGVCHARASRYTSSSERATVTPITGAARNIIRTRHSSTSRPVARCR